MKQLINSSEQWAQSYQQLKPEKFSVVGPNFSFFISENSQKFVLLSSVKCFQKSAQLAASENLCRIFSIFKSRGFRCFSQLHFLPLLLLLLYLLRHKKRQKKCFGARVLEGRPQFSNISSPPWLHFQSRVSAQKCTTMDYTQTEETGQRERRVESDSFVRLNTN